MSAPLLDLPRDRFRELCSALWRYAGVEQTTWVVIPGEPKVKQRARNGQGRTYRVDRADEQWIACHLRQAHRAPLIAGPVALVAVFYRSTLHTFDTDNAMKLVKDAGNGVVWRDDRQVRAELGLLELDRENPHTVVVFGSSHREAS